jgi:hypothetical protein
MKGIKNYIINDCGCTKSHFREIFFKIINYLLFEEIINNLNLDEIKELSTQLDKILWERLHELASLATSAHEPSGKDGWVKNFNV